MVRSSDEFKMAAFRCTGRSRGCREDLAPPLNNPGSATAARGC